MTEYEVYNLVFPDYCEEMKIFGYKFKRENDYSVKLKQLQHLCPVYPFKEFRIIENPGTNSITAKVEIPEEEKDSVLPWKDGRKALHDILLLLSLLTQREVFLNEPKKGICVANPNIFEWGGLLNASVPQKNKTINGKDIKYKDIENCVNKIYRYIRDDEWLKKYGNGFFLLLLKHAFKRQLVESSFVKCYTIWEHLYSILKHNKCLKQTIGSGEPKKISSLLNKFNLLDNKNDCIKSSKIFYETRKSLVHFGKFLDLKKGDPEIFFLYGFEDHKISYPDDKSKDDAILFIRLTEVLTARILELEVNDICSSKKNLEKRLCEDMKFINNRR